MMKYVISLLFIIGLISKGLSQESLPHAFLKSASKIEFQQIPGGFYLIKSTDIKQFCIKNKAELIQKHQGNFYVIKTTQNITLSSSDVFFEIDNKWKLAPALLSEYQEGLPRSRRKKTRVSVHTLNKDVFKSGWIYNYRNNYVVDVTPAELEQLLENENVSRIDLYRRPRVETPVVENDISVNRINKVHRLYPEINGEDLVVSVKELLFDVNDIDFRNRIRLVGTEAEETEQHASLIGTVIGGGGNSSSRGRGVANAVTLSSSSFLQLFPDDEQILSSNSISVQNHSYGVGIDNQYGNEAAAYDTNTNTLPTILHIFSSGNSGNLTSENGPYAGIPNFANQTGNFKMAKNIITVGAINRDGVIDERSSRGPAYDGRVKPEMVSYAPGGTSDAAALVSGTAILLQQQYQENNNQLPPSSLVKAVLIAGSDDVGPVGIDFLSGYGNLNAGQSIEIMRNDLFIEDRIAASESKDFVISVPANTSLLKIALTWNDPAANPGDQTALVNDLDMSLNNGGNTWLPWVLNSNADINLLSQQAQRAEDHLNNVEFITLDNPAAGSYTITINGTDIAGNGQDFSVAYQFIASDEFSWSFPTSTDALESNIENIVRWDNSFSESTATLEYNLNDTGWQLLDDQVDLQSDLFRWPVEDIGGSARLRMTVGNQQFESENFGISPELLPRVLFNCDEELLLGWSEVPNATAYNVRFLDDRYMEITQTVTDTTALLVKADFQESFFSVEAVFDDVQGKRGRAIDYELQGVDCYFSNFFAFLADDSFVSTTLNLSTSINVSQVIFEKTNGGNTETIAVFDPPFEELSLSFDDPNLISGTNTYRATIILEDGTRIQTDPAEIFIPMENTLILFPNPISAGSDLNVISIGADQTFEIVDLSGRVVEKGEISFINELVDIELRPGFYIFRTIRDGRTVEARKFIVN
ncbi:S8 family serine peptidase [Leptobacterium flavescens]|uniref:S8 family serine peptidase n=1 Tax=Leptobacterium flavescens TaxID=472055 RepID=A0A6P0UMT1_9FLAO|nr:S8 family peptidase [Leptobacterium flavescens]NER12323.1 S8 family serine peptidase [Leptobacterium flavescens]